MSKKLFCEISPLTYRIAVVKNKLQRSIIWMTDEKKYSKNFSKKALPESVYKHKSLIRRTLGGVDPVLQNNKAVNLSIAAPKLDGILIKPGETFSFWQLVGACSKRKGYLEGLMIKGGKVSSDIGGGMCQMTNLIHWMVVHSPLSISEHHHHNGIDMFPDYKRTLPFGTGTSIMHNYLDYQFTNNTDQSYQLMIQVGETYLAGQLRCEKPLKYAYHVVEEDHFFIKQEDGYYRHNKIFKNTIDKETGILLYHQMLIENYSKVIYDESFIPRELIQRGEDINETENRIITDERKTG